MKRSRRGGRRPQHNNNHSHNGGGGGHNPNRTFDSSGPEIKIRGSASHVYEKYLQLARDANSSGDRIMAENYLQHAEHYYRIMAAQQAQQAQYQQSQQNQQSYNNQNGQPNRQPGGPEEPNGNVAQPASGPSFSLTDNASADEEEGEEANAD